MSPAVTPDVDKILRGVFDELGEAGIWRDDGQVVQGRFEKRYCRADECPGVEIDIRELETIHVVSRGQVAS